MTLRVTVTFLLLFTIVVPLRAQTPSGEISGVVTDQTDRGVQVRLGEGLADVLGRTPDDELYLALVRRCFANVVEAGLQCGEVQMHTLDGRGRTRCRQSVSAGVVGHSDDGRP